MDKYFSDFKGMKESFKKAVQSRVLPGWIWLGMGKEGQLIITQTNNEDNTLMQGKGNVLLIVIIGISTAICTPIIGLDLWEHAYFTQFEGNKESYVDAFWNYLDWEKISKDFEMFNLEGGKMAPLIA